MPVLYCASPEYLANRGTPQHPHDLVTHDCLMFRVPVDGRLLAWEFIQDGLRFSPDIKPSMVCNDIDSLANLAISGAGIARLGAFVAPQQIQDGKLVALFQHPSNEQSAELECEPLEFYACFRDQHALTKKVRAFVDYVVSAIPQEWVSKPR